MTTTSWTPKLTNGASVDGTSGTGKCVSANEVRRFAAQIAAKKESASASCVAPTDTTTV